MSIKSFCVNSQTAGSRLDVFVKKQIPILSRCTLQKLIKEGNILLNNKINKSSYVLKVDDIIAIDDSQLSSLKLELIPSKFDLEIIDETEDFIAINKPIGLSVHPTHNCNEITVVSKFLSYYPSISKAILDDKNTIDAMRPGIIHRLDKNTTGVMIVAKHKQSLIDLKKFFHDRKIKKEYLALVFGWPKDNLSVNARLSRSKPDRRKMVVDPTGKAAHTDFKVEAYYSLGSQQYSLLRVMPKTGRTHQIRAHLYHLGYPIIGDAVYGSHENRISSKKLSIVRPLLHAASLQFSYKNRMFKLTSKFPDDMKQLINKFKEVNE